MSRARVLIFAAALLVLLIVAIALVPTSGSKLRAMTCDELTAEMLKMTGPDATEPYDLERARQINAVRESKDCDNPFLNPEG